MDKVTWSKIQNIFEKAIEFHGPEQREYIKQACDGDKELYDEVVSLLAADTRVHSLLDGLAIDALEMPESFYPDGTEIDRYRILKKIAEGGMGHVYLAERTDGQIKRRVALKTIKKGINSDEIIRRFINERHILARLEHPSIARLFDAGIHTDGTPFYTMEFIDGQPIDRYCDENKLNVKERLKLFLKVSDAVSYAHRNLIVHRDLKPGNIFVDKTGAVKLLDFGIAKVIDPMEDQFQHTAPGQRLLTPEYASPEQIKNQPVTALSDVYQLGVILYELMCSQRPFELKNGDQQKLEKEITDTTPSGFLQKIVENDISQISSLRNTSPVQLKRHLKGDIEKICAKALRKEPEQRYHSVDALIEDIENYLEARPVQARKGSATYLFKKFVHRHRLAVTTVSIILLIITSLVTFYTIELRKERDRAQKEAEKAQQTASFLADIFRVADPGESRGDDITASELLDNGAKRLANELEDQPEVKASLMLTIGNVYLNLGMFDEAEPLIKKSLKIRRELFGLYNQDVSETFSALNKLYYEQGKYDSSESTIRKKIDISQKIHGMVHSDVALGYNDLAWIMLEKGSYQEADSFNNIALNIRRELFGEEHVDIAESISNMGSVYYGMGELDKALQYYLKSLDMRKKLLGNDHPLIAQNYNNLGLTYEDQRQFEKADSLYNLALKLNIKLYGLESPQVGWSYQDLARSTGRQGNIGQAIILSRKSAQVRERTLGENHIMYAYSLDYLGDGFLLNGQVDSAIFYYDKSISIYRQADSSTWIYMASPLKGMGEALMQKEKYRQAETYLREALFLRESNLTPGNFVIARAKTTLAKCLISMKRFTEAEELLLSAMEIFAALQGQYESSRQKTIRQLVDLYQNWNKIDKADSYRAMLN